MINKKLLCGLLMAGLLICSPLGAVQGVAAADETITIFAADSLEGAMYDFKGNYEHSYGREINLTCKGSNALVNDILNGARPDILLSADVGLIDQRLIPNKYTGWDAEFLTNSMVIAYRKNSTDSDKITSDNWFDIFNQPNAKFGLGDPNKDPGGYRAAMMIQLANKYYKNDNIFNNLIASNSAIFSKENGSGYTIYSPMQNEANKYKLSIDNDSRQSMKALKDGKIDYAIVYKNLAAEYQDGDPNIQYISLPNELALDDINYNYSNINLIENYDNETGKKTIQLSPILYGATLLNWANDDSVKEEAMGFILSDIFGSEYIFSLNVLKPPLNLTNASDYWSVPDSLKRFIVGPPDSFRQHTFSKANTLT